MVPRSNVTKDWEILSVFVFLFCSDVIALASDTMTTIDNTCNMSSHDNHPTIVTMPYLYTVHGYMGCQEHTG